jgi:hypothetical protein
LSEQHIKCISFFIAYYVNILDMKLEIMFGVSLSILILLILTVSVQVGNGSATFIGDAFAQNTSSREGDFFPSPAKPTNPNLQAFNCTPDHTIPKHLTTGRL